MYKYTFLEIFVQWKKIIQQVNLAYVCTKCHGIANATSNSMCIHLNFVYSDHFQQEHIKV